MRGKIYSSVNAVPAQIILDICLTPQRRQRPSSQRKRLLELVTHPALDRTQPRRTKNPPKTILQVTSRNTQTRKLTLGTGMSWRPLSPQETLNQFNLQQYHLLHGATKGPHETLDTMALWATKQIPRTTCVHHPYTP